MVNGLLFPVTHEKGFASFLKETTMSYKSILSTALATTFLGGCVLIDASTDAPSSTLSAVSPAQPEFSTALTQQASAQVILDRAIEAAGGREALQGLRDGEMTLSVRAARVGQDLKPDAVPTLGDASRTIVARGNGLVAIERFNGDTLGSRYIREALGDWIWFAGQNTVADVEPILAAGIIAQADSSAHILLEASDRSQFLRASGKSIVDRKTYNMVSFADRLGRLQTLSFDTETGMLSHVESLSAHAQWGDVATVRSFSDYRAVNGAKLAHVATTRQGAATVSEYRIESVSTAAVDAARFEKPANATQNDPFTAPSAAPRELAVETLSPGVHFIENAAQGYNVIFVEQADGVLVLETPQSPQTGRDIVRAIKGKLPGKAIKGAVLTHHHFDHSGGLYGFIEAGVPIMTTPGNVDFVKAVGTSNRNIGQNEGRASNPVVNAFEGELTLGAAGNEVRLYNVGPNPHAEEVVVAYIPAIKAMFVADLFSARGDELPAANANQLAFADRLEGLNLDIEMFIPVHGRKATPAEFWASVKAGREAAIAAETN